MSRTIADLPLTEDQRRGNYIRQNDGAVMTPRQRRRWRHKMNRAMALTRKLAGR